MTSLYEEIIANLMLESQDIKAVAFISSDGLMLHSNISDIDPTKVAALSAAILGLAKKSSSEMNFGALNEIIIKGGDATYLVLSIDSKKVLTLIVSESANMGMINIIVKSAIRRLSSE